MCYKVKERRNDQNAFLRSPHGAPCRYGSAVLICHGPQVAFAAVTVWSCPKEACHVFYGLRGFQKQLVCVAYRVGWSVKGAKLPLRRQCLLPAAKEGMK